MLKPETLLFYPYVKLRVSCECGYRQAYRVARLAEHFGADVRLDSLLHLLKLGRCPAWGSDGVFCELRCKLAYTDIGSGNPPDVPPAATRPKLLR